MNEDATGTEPPFIVTVRCADLLAPVTGAAVSRCQTCEEPVWLSPTSQGAAKSGGTIICKACWSKEIGKGGTSKPLPLTDEQRVEIARATGLYGDALDRAIARVEQRLSQKEL